MKAVIRIIFATALLVTSSLSAATVNNVELSYEQGYTVAKIYVDGAVRFTHQSEIAKDGKPYRIIVDVLSAEHGLGGKVFSEVPACAIKGIRSSQFSVTPEKVCRIVFDMVGETIYRTEQQADAVVLYISDGFSQPFTNWSSKSWVASTHAPEHDEPATAVAPAVAVTETESAPTTSTSGMNAAITNDHLASLQGESAPEIKNEELIQEDTSTANLADSATSHPGTADDVVQDTEDRGMSEAAKLLAQSFSAHAAIAQDAVDSTKPLDSIVAETANAATSDSTVDEPLTDTIVKVYSESTAVVDETQMATSPDAIPSATEVVVEEQPAPSVPIVSAANVSENPVTATPASAESTLVPSESTRVRERASRRKFAPMSSLGPDFDVTMNDPVAAETPTAKSVAGESESATEPGINAQPEPAMLADADATTIMEQPKPSVESPAPSLKPAMATESKKNSVETIKPSPKTVVAGESKSSVSSGDTMASEKPSPADVAPAVDTASTSQPSNSDESKAKGTARFRRDPITSKKMRGTLVAEFPQRLVIQYKGKSNRDPFETLVDQEKQYNTPVEKRVPNVEGLTLVGVIETGWGDNRALFEDRSGHGYIMQSGDKVQKGYVLRVEKDRVYFQLFEYGWSRTVSITIEDE